MKGLAAAELCAKRTAVRDDAWTQEVAIPLKYNVRLIVMNMHYCTNLITVGLKPPFTANFRVLVKVGGDNQDYHY